MQEFREIIVKVISRHLKRVGLAVGVVTVLSCGGGGGGGQPTVSSEPIGSATLAAGVAAVPQQTVQSLTVAETNDGLTQITLPDSAILLQNGREVAASSVTVGALVLLAPGADSRFPFGLAGKVAIISSSGGTTQLVLESSGLAEVMSESTSTTAQPVQLSADNLVGVIAPAAVQTQQGVQASSLLSRRSMQGVRASVFADDAGSVTGTSISLNYVVSLAEMVDEPSKLKAHGTSGEVKVVVTGSLKNLTLVQNIDYSAAGGLKSMKMQIDGDIDIEAKLEGGVVGEVGYFSRAWKEVEDQKFGLLGMSAKLTGLDSKDKVGKYPLAGLVFSVPCPQTCPISPGQTQTPLRAAKWGGVIVWVYLTNKGTIELDGAIGMRVNAGHLTLGVEKAQDGTITGMRSLTPKSSSPLLQSPFLTGSVSVTLRNGVSVDADMFLGGVRVANASVFAGAQNQMTLTASAGQELAYSAQDLDSDWQITTPIGYCYTATEGAGAIFAYATRFGLQSGSVSIDLSAADQYPSEADMANSGKHGTWFTWPPVDTCGSSSGGSSSSGGGSSSSGGGGSTPPTGSTGKLNDTGIQVCGAATSGNGVCDGTQPAGQDAQYGRDAQAAAGTLSKIGGGDAGFDFMALDASGNPTTPGSSTNSHPCVRDNVTGLIWEVKTDDGGLRDKDWTFTWYNANSPDGNAGTASGGVCYQSDRCDTEKYVADVNAAGLCGYQDWRMPMAKELEGIVHLGRTSPAIDPTYFPNTPDSFYWSAIPYAGYTDSAWAVDFGFGFAFREIRSNGVGSVRLVRSGSGI